MYSVKLWICLPETNTVSSRINLMIRCLKVTQRLKYFDNSPTSPSYVCHKPPYIQEEGLVIIHRWIWITRALPVLLVPSMHSGSDAHHPLRVRRQQAAGSAHYTPAVPPTTHLQHLPAPQCCWSTTARMFLRSWNLFTFNYKINPTHPLSKDVNIIN